MLLVNYLLPIFGQHADIIGQGFIADGYFITASHVLNPDSAAYIVYQGKTISLTKETPIVNSCPPMENGIVNLDETSPADVAVFNFKGVSSPLHLSEYVPSKGEELLSLCVFDNHNNTIFSAEPGEVIEEYVLTEKRGVTMQERAGNYYGCVINRRGASSGSPLLIGNEVVGIMHGGHDNDICVCLSAKAVIDLLKSKL